MSYNWNIAQTIQRQIPAKIKAYYPDAFAQLQAWLYTLLFPLESLYAAFVVFVIETNYKTAITGQVVYLEKALNDKFDAVLAGIYISDGDPLNEVYLYDQAASPDSPPNIYDQGDVDPDEDFVYDHSTYEERFDFIVNVPSYVMFTTHIMKALIDYYKPAGKRYQIVIY